MPSRPCRRSGRKLCTARKEINVDFTLPEHLPGLLAEMDEFIEADIKPLEREHIQYFDRRREHARTDWDNDGIPSREWEELLAEMRRRADRAGWLRYGLPASLGGRDGTNVDMAVIREHLAHKGLGLHNDLQNESSIVGKLPAGDHDGALRHRGATPSLVGGADHRGTLDGVRPHRAAARLGRDLAGNTCRTRRGRLGDQRLQAVQHRRTPRNPRPDLRPHVG